MVEYPKIYFKYLIILVEEKLSGMKVYLNKSPVINIEITIDLFLILLMNL